MLKWVTPANMKAVYLLAVTKVEYLVGNHKYQINLPTSKTMLNRCFNKYR